MAKKSDKWSGRSGNLKKFDKPVFSVDEQVEHMKSRGMVFPGQEESLAKDFLMVNNYYKFAHFYKYFADQNHIIHVNHYNKNFSFFQNIYFFDLKFKVVLLEFLLKMETFLKTQYAYNVTLNSSSSHPYDDIFEIKHQESAKNCILNIKNNNCETQPLKHYFEKYEENCPPLWTLVEVMTFDSLLKVIEYTKDVFLKKDGSDCFGYGLPGYTKKKLLYDLRNVKVLRNRCAHNNPLWHIKDESSFNLKESIINLFNFLKHWDCNDSKKMEVNIKSTFIGVTQECLDGYGVKSVAEFFNE